ncbi:hypothetical protein [uncultured Fibrobacter sp.]|uniref:hypothetical protein n=1 Tax=uncultured Fibrobacter sp. TaxID=261512 RepID=UPI00260B0254|nr:hypothetical protein [uncultured Fibrobacter sp.]
MTLTKRIQELLLTMSGDLPEREYCLQLAFLAAITGEPFYLYGRPGSGKGILMNRLISSFRNPKILKVSNNQPLLTEGASNYDIVVFHNFEPTNDTIKDNVKMVLLDRTDAAVILSSDIRPENAMGRANIADEITLTVHMPDSLSADALCALLKNQSKKEAFHMPAGLTISVEEKRTWNEEIKKVTLSEDTLSIIGNLAELCKENGIYVPISKWLSLSHMAKAIAYFNGRTETTFTDALFLGGSIWGRSTSNSAIMENFGNIVKSVFMKNIPEALEGPYPAEDLYNKVTTILRSSNNLYETKDFNGEPCVSYHVTIAGEQTPLYVPLRYIETDEEFNPYNELRKVEKHVRCNFHGTSSCTISIETSVKGIGLRNTMTRSNTSSSGKFEDFATLPTYILRENDPEVARQKKTRLEELQKEAVFQMERQAKLLRSLRDLYQASKVHRDDLFCDKVYFDKLLNELRETFDTVNGVAAKLKDTLSLFN